MTLTYENFLPLSYFQRAGNRVLKDRNAFNFLSFQDALHYLVRAHNLAGKKILLPSFYCEATIADMQKHGLKVVLCRMDHATLDVNIADFIEKLQTEKPEIVLVYNVFGARSRLYERQDWLQFLTPDALIISDFAHAYFAGHPLVFLGRHHVYIDSTRKTTCRMMAHLVMPDGMAMHHAFISRASLFRYIVRGLFFLKNSMLRLGEKFHCKPLSNAGKRLYLLHDHYIGSHRAAFAGFGWDALLYKHINFHKILAHRTQLYDAYSTAFSPLVEQGHLALFSLPEGEGKNLAFFVARVVETHKVAALLEHFERADIWADVLWDFDAIEGMDEEDRNWAKSVVVFPYTVHTTASHVKKIADLLQEFFHG